MARTTPAAAPRALDRWRSAGRDDRLADWLASLTFVWAVVVVVVSLVRPLREFFSAPDDLVSMLLLPVVPNLAYAALLAVLGVAMRRRLVAAWWSFVGLLLVVPSVVRVAALTVGQHPVANLSGLAVAGALLAVALVARPQFTARAARAAWVRAVVVLAVGLAVTLAVGTWLLLRFGTAPDAGTALAVVIDRLLGDIGLLGDESVRAPLWVRFAVSLLAATSIIGAAVALFRAPSHTRALTPRDEAWVRTLLRGFGDQDSLGYFATRRDKSVVWDVPEPAEPRAGVSYRVVNGVSLASGNPLGDPARWSVAIDAWRQEARRNGWSVAVMGAGESGAHAYEEAGLVAFEIGDEAVLDLTQFALAGPGMKPVRQAVTRLRRRGMVTRVCRHSALSAQDLDELGAAAARWRGDGGDERGFSMALGRLGDPLDGDCVLVEARDAQGRLAGFLSFVPWGRDGLSLDLMRRDPEAGNGVVELLVTSLAEQAPRLQVRRASLNFAMFREAFERGEAIGAGPLARLGRQALLFASRTWQLESLYRSNAKYLPQWQPRFVCFEYGSDIPRVGIAAGSAEGFLARPSVATLLRRGSAQQVTLSRAAESYVAAVQAQLPAEPDHVAEALAVHRLPEQMRVRRRKLADLEAAGVDPYPVGYPRDTSLSQVRREASGLPPDTRTGRTPAVTGRVLRKRDFGGLCFLLLRDGTADLQVMARRDRVGATDLARFRGLDLGDHVGVTGEVVTTHTGELTLDVASFALTSKALRPLPDKRLGLSDPEQRVRLRYVDLAVRPAARDVAYLRAAVVRSLRDSLHARGFTEVETPVLQLVHGGATARPFQTHINAYDLDLSLRIATELHLKRLVVGGMEQVFEIGRQFRNEGADSSHNPEFTSLEAYQAYGDYTTMRVLTQELVQEAATAVYGVPVARRRSPDGGSVEVDLSGDWPVRTVCDAVSLALGEEVTADTSAEELRRHAEKLGLEPGPAASWGVLLEAVYEVLCEDATTTPVFYTDFPRDTSPLTRRHRDAPRLVEKWDLVMWGSEQATAYSELVDPVDQRTRLVQQSLLAAAGDPEAMRVDEDFLHALEYGMPPTGGMGLGVDRLVMNLTGLGIRDTILFPLVRPS